MGGGTGEKGGRFAQLLKTSHIFGQRKELGFIFPQLPFTFKLHTFFLKQKGTFFETT